MPTLQDHDNVLNESFLPGHFPHFQFIHSSNIIVVHAGDNDACMNHVTSRNSDEIGEPCGQSITGCGLTLPGFMEAVELGCLVLLRKDCSPSARTLHGKGVG